MAALSESRLRQITDRFEQIEARMGVATDSKEIVQLSRDHTELKRVAEKAREVMSLRDQLAEADALAEDASADRELVNMAIEERADIKARLPDVEREMQLMLLPKDRDDDGSAVIEVRAGTGGDEAALFAGDLWRMYQRYAQGRKWSVEIVSSTDGEMGGYKEVVFSITGDEAYQHLQFESGGHRVQRVPKTEQQGRIHTSAATVAVLPEPDEVPIEIKDQDIKWERMRAGGAGGQHVNKTESAVRIWHLPTGLEVKCQDERSQHKNYERAMRILRSRLYEMQQQKLHKERAEQRRTLIGSGDRSERIRTYNFPQNRVTDHRINLTTHDLPAVMNGDIGKLIEALKLADVEEKLAGGNTE